MPYRYQHGDRPVEGFSIQRAVGRGGFGEVYYALSDSGKQVALKYLRDNPEIELRGISPVMNLKSPHLITIYDVRENEDREPFVVMEYVSGPSLHDLLNNEPNGLGPQKAAYFLCGIANGLSYLHERGIVHRDMKPGNIFYDDGYVKIGDYGLSKHIAVSRHSGQTVSVGTVHYMAPEIGSGNYSKAIDIYSVGVILYEMLTGRLPFTGSSMGEVLMRHLSDAPDISGIPQPFASVIAKALEKDPLKRYTNVNEMVDAVKESVGISASIASFNPASLAGVPRDERADDADRTVTSTPQPPPVPVLDARSIADEPFPPGLPPRIAKKVRKAREKMAKKMAKAQKKAQRTAAMAAFCAPCGDEPVQVAQPGQPPLGVPMHTRGRGLHFIVLMLVIGAVAVGMFFTAGPRGQEQAAVAYGLYMFGGMLGALIAHFALVRRNLLHNTLFSRIAYVGVAFPFMIPGIAVGSSASRGHLEMLFLPILASFVLCDWNKRIEAGRKNQIRGANVISPAIIGLVGGALVDMDQPWIAAGICAMIALLVQAAASMWPHGAPARVRRRGQWGEKTWQRVEGAITNASEHVGKAVEKAAEGFERGWGRAEQAAPKVQTPATPPPPAESAESPSHTRAMIDPAQPSFVGRTANAGLSFVGKVLLLAGITAAMFWNGLPMVDVKENGGQTVAVNMEKGKFTVVEHGISTVDVTIPPAVMIFPILIGSFFLIASRRNDGGAHFARGLIGCVLLLTAGILAVGPAADGLGTLMEAGSDFSELTHVNVATLACMGGTLVSALALLFWPRKQYGKPLVI